MTGPAAVEVAFRVGDEAFALPAAAVEEALENARLEALPALASHAAGLLRYRGRWIPALDPGPMLGLPAAARPHALVLRRGRIRFALAVDAIAGIHEDFGDVLVTPLDPETLFEAGLPPGWEDEEMPQDPVVAPPIPIVVLRLGEDLLAMRVSGVHEVLAWEPPSRVPGAPDFVDGVLSVRDQAVPIISLRGRLGLPEREPGAGARIVVVELDGERVGLVADSVTQIVRLPADQLQEPPAYFRGLAARYLEGLFRHDERIAILLRIDRILSSEERLALQATDLEEPGREGS